MIPQVVENDREQVLHAAIDDVWDSLDYTGDCSGRATGRSVQGPNLAFVHRREEVRETSFTRSRGLCCFIVVASKSRQWMISSNDKTHVSFSSHDVSALDTKMPFPVISWPFFVCTWNFKDTEW